MSKFSEFWKGPRISKGAVRLNDRITAEGISGEWQVLEIKANGELFVVGKKKSSSGEWDKETVREGDIETVNGHPYSYTNKMGIDAAGPVPESLLARQDLEEAHKSGKKKLYFKEEDEDDSGRPVGPLVDENGNALQGGWVNLEVATDIARRMGAELIRKSESSKANLVAKLNTNNDDWEIVDSKTGQVMDVGYDSKAEAEAGIKEMNKSTVDNLKLEDLKDKAEDADTPEQKDKLAGRIKETQIKRQKATLKERGVGKSFSDFWKKHLGKDSEYDIVRPGDNTPEEAENDKAHE